MVPLGLYSLGKTITIIDIMIILDLLILFRQFGLANLMVVVQSMNCDLLVIVD